MREFYVGYLPMPPGVKRFAIALVACLMMVVAGLSLVMAQSQRDPGEARWGTEVKAFEGLLIDQPYPGLLVGGSSPRLMLLVTSGKHGAAARVAPHLGKAVQVHGTVLQRGEIQVLELVDDANAIEEVGLQPTATPSLSASPVARKWRGEIIDPKCYCGAMKPGEGKTHKACAALCLRGGIPPMFVATVDPTHPYLLVNADGHAFSTEQLETLIEFVGDAVTFSARSGSIEDMATLNVELSTLKRP